MSTHHETQAAPHIGGAPRLVAFALDGGGLRLQAPVVGGGPWCHTTNTTSFVVVHLLWGWAGRRVVDCQNTTVGLFCRHRPAVIVASSPVWGNRRVMSTPYREGVGGPGAGSGGLCCCPPVPAVWFGGGV